MKVSSRFLRSSDGNVAIFAALLAVPLLIGAGLAMDYATVSRVNHELQGALDTAALAVAREGKAMTDDRARQVVAQFVSANFNGTVDGVTVNRSAYSVKVSATVTPALAFSGLLGNNIWQVTNDSTAEYAPAKFEIALALDQTGSMAGAKLAAMKDAVNTMVEAMSLQVTDPAALKIGVVPYATFVNVGPQYGPSFDKKGKVDKKTGADWLDIEGKVKTDQIELPDNLSRFEVYEALGRKWPGCVETRMPTKKGEYDVMDIEATSKDKDSLFVPTFSIDEPDDTWPDGFPKYPNNYITSLLPAVADTLSKKELKLAKYGLQKVAGVYVLDPLRSVMMDETNSIFYSNEADPKGPGFGCEVEPLLPLTSNVAAIKAKVNAIKANGSTNITEGVMWAWRVLSDRAPFQEASAKSKGARKILILLTDGTNSYGNLDNELKSGYSSTGYLVDERLDGTNVGSTVGETTAAMNAKTLAACTNAKADGIEIYTIRLEEPNVTTGTLLQECASGADHYFDSPSKEQLTPIFDKIRDMLTVVRLAS